MEGEPVTYAFEPNHLQNLIRVIGLDIVLYKGHIIRIGSATQATLFGYFENCIQKVGR